MWTVPDKGEAQNNIQSILFQEYLDVLVDGLFGANCVLSGGVVSAQGTPNMTTAVAKAAVISNGTMFAVAAANATHSAADGTNPRIDLVVINSAGAIAVRGGTPAANPLPPNRTANDVVLAAVFIPASDTTVSSDQIIDMRVVRGGAASGGGAGIVIKKVTTPVTHNTDAAAFTYFTITLPSGLFLAGQVLRIRCGGNYLSNSGTPTWTLTIAYGGTTMFADATAVTAADADRGAWSVEFDLVAQASNDQALNGVVHFQTPGTKTAPTSGQAGDLAVVTSVNEPIAGSAAVDSDAADRTLTVQWTMSVSNVAVETVMEYATAELL